MTESEGGDKPGAGGATLVRRALQVAAASGLVLAGLFGVAVPVARRIPLLSARGPAGSGAHAVAGARSLVRPLDEEVPRVPLAGEVSRRVLGVYSGLDPDTTAEENLLHTKAELVLSHLGLVLDLVDANGDLPGPGEMARYRGVVTWITGDRLRRPLAYLRWLRRQAQAGRRVVILDGLGARADEAGRAVAASARAATLRAVGVEPLGQETDDSDLIELVSKDAGMVEMERPLPAPLEIYARFRLLDPGGRSFLRLRRRDLPGSESDLVVVTGRGGFAARGYVFAGGQFGRNYVNQWRLDPFRFLALALGVEATPRPDATTLYGARIFFSHIDGDGLPSISEVDRKTTCGEMVRREILARYPLPVTASFVVAGIAPPPVGLGSRHRLAVARRIARLPNVELASHGFAHPMDWRARGRAVVSYEVPGYAMSAEKEVTFSIRYIDEHIAPPGKRVTVMLWTGWCNPAPDQLALAYRAGVYNMNGGDPVMDAQTPSYMHLAPRVHRVGGLDQYYTTGPNEFILTEEWTPPYHRWGNLIQTLERTGSPRRVYPINVYYHYYISEKRGALEATHRIMRWVLRQRPAPLWVSQYIDVLRDARAARVARVGPRRWRVLNSGFARTVRFDLPEAHVDLGASRGVVGYLRLRALGALYVHLDESHDHLVVLADAPWRGPYLRRATAYADGVRLARDRGVLTLRGVGEKYVTLANLAPGATYRYASRNRQGRSRGALAHSDAHGTLHLRVAVDPFRPEEVRVTYARVAGRP